MDSLEPHESNMKTLRCISSGHKWVNSNDQNARVENARLFNDSDESIYQKNFSIIKRAKPDIEEDETIEMLNQLDLSLNHYDVQLQVKNGKMEQAIRYGVFTSSSSSLSLSSSSVNTFRINQYSQTIEPEMDMDGRNGNYNGNSRQYNGNNNNNNNSYNNNNNNDDGSYRRNRQSNGSSGNGNGNGSNPNRNNNSRR